MSKYYAIKKGIKVGIFTSWDSCKKYVDGYSGAEYKSFTHRKDAEEYLSGKPVVSFSNYDVIAYVDGSFDLDKGIYSYGCVIIVDNDIAEKLSGVENKYIEMNNVAGEILASLKSIEWAISKKFSSINIFHDYEGIQKWADGVWEAKKLGTTEYKHLISEYRKLIDIKFTKVKAHSGNIYNEMADKLASETLKYSEDIKSNSDDMGVIFHKIFTKNSKLCKNRYAIIVDDYEITEKGLKKFVEDIWVADGNDKSDIGSVQLELKNGCLTWEVKNKKGRSSLYDFKI